jgi:hypothetical protein
VNDVNQIASRRPQGQVKRISHIFSPHMRTELPRDDVAAVIVQYCAEIEPAPANHLQIGEVRLPKLIDGCGFVLELTGGLDDDEGRAGDEVMCFVTVR